MKKVITGACIVAVGVLIVFYALSLDNNREYKAKIRLYNDSIDILRENNVELLKCLHNSQERVTEALNERDVYVDSLDRQRENEKIIRKRYEKKISDLKSIPTDSLYLQITEWLDTVSFH